MDIRPLYAPVRIVRRHHLMVRWIHGVPCCPSHSCGLERFASVSYFDPPRPQLASNLCRLPSLIRTNPTFRDIVISVVGTYGLYLISSIMHLEPWHMFTSFVQYLFLQPSCEFIPNIDLMHSSDAWPSRYQYSE